MHMQRRQQRAATSSTKWPSQPRCDSATSNFQSILVVNPRLWAALKARCHEQYGVAFAAMVHGVYILIPRDAYNGAPWARRYEPYQAAAAAKVRC